MDDTKKTKSQLISDLQQLRQQISDIKKSKLEKETELISLAESNQIYRDIFEQSFDGFSLVDDKGIIIEWNKAQERITGLSKKDVIGKPVWDAQIQLTPAELKTPEMYKRLQFGYFKALKSEIKNLKDKIQEQNFLCPDGVSKFVQSVSFRIHNDNKLMIGTIMRDVTANKQTEKALKESESLYHDLVETSQDLIWQCDAEGRYTYLNPAWKKVFGYNIKEMLGRKFSDFQTPDYSNRDIKEFKRLLKGNSITGLETCHIGKKGDKIYLVFNAKFIDDENGKIVGTRGTAYNITERKKTEEALKINETKMRSIFRVAPTGIGLVKNRVLLEVNPKLCEIIGYSEKELIDKNSRLLYPSQKEFQYVGEKKYRQIAKNGSGIVETKWKKKDGTVIDILLASTPVDINDYSKGVIFTTLDITNRNQSEKALIESEERYRRISEVASDYAFTSTVTKKGTLKLDWVVGAFEAITGYTYKEYVAYGGWRKTLHQEDRNQDDKDMQKLQNNQNVFTEVRTVKKNGSLVWVHVAAQPVWDQQKNTLIGIYGAVRDITERKKAEYNLRESEAKLDAIFQSVKEGIIYTDIKGIVLHVNHPFTQITGIPYNDIIGKNTIQLAKQFVPHDQIPKVLKKVSRAFSGFSLRPYEIEFNNKILEINTTFDKKNKKISVVIKDITDRKLAERELNKRLGYEQLISEISALAIKDESISKFQNKCLSILSKTLDVSRIYIFEYHESSDTLDNTYEWTTKGITSEKDNLQGIPASEFTWWMKMMKNNEVINYHNIEEIPAEQEKQFLLEQNIKSILVVPLFVENKFYGFIGFDECRKQKEWPQPDVMVLHSVARIICGVIEKKQADEALKESEKLLRQVIDTAPYSIFVKDNEGQYILVNKQMAESHSTTPNQLIGKTDLSIAKKWLTTPEAVKQFRDSEREVTERKKQLIINEEKFTFQDGIEKWFQTIKTPISLKDNPHCLMGMAVDITERKQAEESIKESEVRYRLLFEANPHSMMVYDIESLAILAINDAAVLLYGYTRNEFLNMTIKDIRPSEDIPALLKKIATVTEGLDQAGIWRHQKKDGTIINVEITSHTLIWAGRRSEVVLINDVTERKKAENTLWESEKRFQSLIQSASDGIIISDEAGKITLWNTGASKIFGYKNSEIIGKSITEIMPEQYRRAHSEGIKRIVKTGNSKIIGKILELEGLKKDSSVFPLELSLSMWQIQDKKYFSAITRDITERKQAVETLNKRTHDLNERVKELNGLYGASQLITNPHNSVEDVLQGTLDLIPSSWQYPESTCAKIKYENKVFKTANWKKTRWIQSADIFYKNNKKGNIEVNYLEKKPKIDEGPFLKEERNLIDSFARILGDFIEHKQAEEALHESEEKYRLIVENAHDGIEITQNNQIIFANTRFAEMLGFNVEEIKQLPFSQFFTNQATQDLIDRKKNRDNGKSLPYQYETTFRKKDGTIIDVDVKYEIIRYNNNPATFAIIRDITDLKKTEVEKTKLEEQLRRSQKLETIGTLAGGIAHDFNNILAPIMGYTDMALLNLKKSNPLYDDLQHVLKGTYRAKELVEQILLFSKKSEKEKQPLALQSLVKEALKLLRPSIPTTIEIRKRIDETCSKIMADATQMHQVIINLCTNAWQAMEDKGGTLTLTVNQVKIDASTAKINPNLNESEYIQLSVVDTGEGMDNETLERIFEPFYTTKTVDKGTGLGLSVVHGIVHSHSGDIQVYSEKRKGSAFHVYIPIISNQDEISKTTSEKILGGTESILIVDDETEIASLVKRMLENFGYKVDIYLNGFDALKVIKKQPKKYQLLISDLTMPQMTGLDLSDQIHKNYPQFPILIMTGFGDKITLSTQKRYGIKQVIGKPIIIQDLTTAVRTVLDEK